MMKRILSSLTVLLLATVLTVFAFGATVSGAYSSLALGEAGTGVDYTALEVGDTFTVYIVVGPTAKGGSQAKQVIYRPYGTAMDGLQAGANNRDIGSQTFLVEWDETKLALQGDPVYADAATNGTTTYTDKDGNTLTQAHMAFLAIGSYVKPIVTLADGSASFEYAPTAANQDNISATVTTSNAGKMLGFANNWTSAPSNYAYNCAVVELTFKVLASDGGASDITLTDTYSIVNGSNYNYTYSNQANKKATVSIVASCTHPETNRVNYTVVDPASCFKAGLATYDCNSCGVTGIEEVLEKLPHVYETEYDESKYVSYPDCANNGEAYLYCTNDGCYEYSEEGARKPDSKWEVPALGHDWVYVKVAEVSCTVRGEEFWYCARCTHPSAQFTVDTPASNAAVANAWYYNSADQKFYTDADFTQLPDKTPAEANQLWYHITPALAHQFEYVKLADLACEVDREEFWYCTVCEHPSSAFTDAENAPTSNGAAGVDMNTYVVYNQANNTAHFYSDAEKTSEIAKGNLGTWFNVTEGLAHNWVRNPDGTYTCLNTDVCSGENPLVRYVGAEKNGNGATKESYTTLSEAFEYFTRQGLTAEDNVTIYLVEDISLVNRRVSSNNANASFEEDPHDYKLTITSLNKNNKATLTLTAAAPDYYLYGPTTFENIKITSDVAGTSTSGGRYFVARGFKLVMGKGIEMVDVSGKISSSKTDSGIDGFGTTVDISDAKIYVIGGLKKGGYREGFDDNTKTFHTELEVLSGNYWSIYHFNRSITNKVLEGCTSFVTIGAVTSDTLLTTSEVNEFNNCHSVTVYTGKFNIRLDYLYTMDAKSTGSGNRIDRIYMPGSNNASLGDFALNKVFKVSADATAYYYDGINKASNISKKFIKGHEAKAKVGTNANYVNFTMTTAPLSECLYGSKFLGTENGHEYGENGVCTFCETKPCNVHTTTEWFVSKEPTCSEDGLKQRHCTVCYAAVGEAVVIEATGEHTYVWADNSGIFTAKCSVCGLENSMVEDDEEGAQIKVPAPSERTNIYVSVNGTGLGGFSPESPLNDFDMAMKFAASAGADATIHIMDEIVIVQNNNGNGNYTFNEPTHTNKITIRGYGDTQAIFRHGGYVGVGDGANLVYRLFGPTAFENIMFSTGGAPGKFYVLCEHNPVEFGENISADMQRVVTSGPTSKLSVYGGCYDKSCEKTGADITIRSGNYNDIVGGTVRATCGVNASVKEPVNIRILGNITVNEFFVVGGFGAANKAASVSNANLLLDGELMVNQYFSAGSTGGDVSQTGNAGDVTIKIISGTIVAGSWSHTHVALGAPAYDGACATDGLNSLSVYYFPTKSSTRILCERLAAASDITKFTSHILTEDNFCTESLAGHTPVDENGVVSLAATCYGEGYKTFECANCGEEYIEVIAIAPHYLVDMGVVAANCVSPALNKQVCQNEGCGAAVYTVVEGSVIDPTAHSIVDGVCIHCNHTEVQICEADGGHEFGDAIAVDESCGSGTKRVCDTCGYVEVDIENATHNYGPYTITVEPTEAAPGVKTRTCKSCGKVDSAMVSSADTLYTDPLATDAQGNAADLDIALSKLSKYERVAINSLLQETAYGSEVKVSYSVDGEGVTNITYSIPVPAEYNDMTNVKVVVKDDEGKFHVVDFKLEKGYIVFTF